MRYPKCLKMFRAEEVNLTTKMKQNGSLQTFSTFITIANNLKIGVTASNAASLQNTDYLHLIVKVL